MVSELLGLFAGAVGLGLVHGAEPGHGWPIAASYAMERKNKWLSGAAAATVLGIGHLVSSIAMVLVFFAAKSYFELTQLTWLPQVAGVLLILLGLNELRGGGHHHGHGDAEGDYAHTHDGDGDDGHKYAFVAVDGHGHSHADAHEGGHSLDSHDHGDDGALARLKAALPFGGGHAHSHSHGLDADPSNTSLRSLAWFAFLLGFAHEEEFEILLLCTGSNYCLELMTVYALTVVFGIVALTLLLVAGYYRYEERMEAVAEHFPTISAAILILMGLGFVFGVF
ncbi:hypothetical protein [Halogeometricum limi]|uniref:ABC-type nickel/cobalt efflux system, permease component RcnA n=1 Tax=Halogeometricum limi TaxID=555875 RepID=A0A1I6GNE0_9EURY|nr:hypothetical protein [Halogeometricum limi]SFR43733.1 hypothetical protein SAMN04488124_1314 [Halogeometricum limi]